MSRDLHHTTPLSTHDLLVTTGPFVLLALVLLVVAYWVLDPSPPRRVVLATGPERERTQSSASAMPSC